MRRMGRRGKKKTNKEKPEEYEVECVSGHSFEPHDLVPGAIVAYNVKWLGYSAHENTYQVTNEFRSWRTILEYWRRRHLNPGENEPPLNKHELEIAQSMMIIHEWQKESVQFSCDDKSLLLPIKTYGWDWIMAWHEKSEDPTEDKFQDILELYEKQVNIIAENFRNHPIMKVQNEIDGALPIPLSKLICKIEMSGRSAPMKRKDWAEYGHCERGKITMNEKECSKAITRIQKMMNSMDPFGPDLEDFSTNDHCRDFEMTDSFMRPMDNHSRRVHLRARRHEDLYWDLLADEDIEAGATIMLLSGELCCLGIATQCMELHGEIVAFNNYINIGKAVSLDTSHRQGFDKYIQHSCDPNCYVEITYPYRRPMATPLCIIKAKKNIAWGQSLTIDWFEGFEFPDPTVDYTSGSTKRDHVICRCYASNCRGILWVERLRDDSGKYRNLSKPQRLKLHKETFVGLPLPQNHVDDRWRVVPKEPVVAVYANRVKEEPEVTDEEGELTGEEGDFEDKKDESNPPDEAERYHSIKEEVE